MAPITAVTTTSAKRKIARRRARPRSSNAKPQRAIGAVWDDDPQFRKTMASQLRRCGFTVISHADRGVLMERLRGLDASPAVAVIDWIDQRKANYKAGLETVRELTTLHKTCFVVVVTGHAKQLAKAIGPEYMNSAFAAGADVVKLKSKLGLLRDRDAFARELWEGVACKQTEAIISANHDFDPASVYAGWSARHDPAHRFLSPASIPERFTECLAAAGQSAQEGRISQLYQEIGNIVNAPPGRHDEARYQALLAELRTQQAIEAEELAVAFERNRPLKEEVALAFIARYSTETP